MKLFLYVEGEMEFHGLKPLLQRSLKSRYDMDLTVEGPRLPPGRKGELQKKGGGTDALRTRIGDICKTLGDEGHVFCLVDLRGYFTNHPVANTWPLSRRSVDAVEGDLRNESRGLAERGRFHPHVAKYETEAWILADQQRLKEYRGSDLRPAEKQGLGAPEQINHSRTSCPKARLEKIIRDYSETRDGVALLSSIDPAEVYRLCPQFREFIDDLAAVQRIIDAEAGSR